MTDKETLIKKYYKEKKTLRQIAKEHNVCHVTVIQWMKKYNLKTRNRSESQIGKKFTKETKLKMRKARLGEKLSEETKRKLSKMIHKPNCSCYFCKAKRGEMKGEKASRYIDGRSLKNYYCKKCGKKITYSSAIYKRGLCGSCAMIERIKDPKNHPRWKGGLSFEPYTSEFNNQLKEQIRKRDNHTCQLCGKTQEEQLEEISFALSVHHIDYDKENCKEDNLITLCHNCHMKTNINRKYWIEYFNNK